MRHSTRTISELKGERPIVAVTAYDAVMARLADEAGVDLILVGDSVGTTQLGFESTVPVTLEMMLHHTAAVVRAGPEALVVADVPFSLAHEEFPAVFESCRRLLQESGAGAVKIEGGASMAPLIRRIIEAGIPVLGHIGLLPQQVLQLGGYRKFGREDEEKASILADAQALEEAGCFAVVGEMMDADLSGEVRKALGIPLIGIGCGSDCDGQILVSNDLLGLTTGPVPKFVKQFADLGSAAKAALSEYAEAVRGRTFPS